MTVQFDEAIPRIRDLWHAHDDAILAMVGESAGRAQEVAGDIVGRVQGAVAEAAPVVGSALQEGLDRAQAIAERELEGQGSSARDKAAVAIAIVVIATAVIGILALIAKRRGAKKATRKRDRRAKRATSRAGEGAATSA